MTANGSLLDSIKHIVVLMLENRSFDHMLGFLYADSGNKSPRTGQPFDGLTGTESNVDSKKNKIPVFKIKATDKNAYFMPCGNPGEGYAATNSQLFNSTKAPSNPAGKMDGFVTDFEYTLSWETTKRPAEVLPGTTPKNIMGMFTPDLLPVLSTLAKQYAVCDHWYASAPTETFPNRAFACAATSQGHMDDHTSSYTVPSIFGLLSDHDIDWMLYGYAEEALARKNFPDTIAAANSHFGLFTDFQAAAKNGTLAAYSFLEPSWGRTGNSQHPNQDLAPGEQLIHDVYYALRNGKDWNETLLIITYDEHGGCYDHVSPPLGAVPPDDSAGEFDFDFTRFGVRVPAVLVSPRIAPGTIFNVPEGATPIDHTSILKTVETRWGLPPLTKRDAAAPSLGAVLTLAQPRTDDALKGVKVPKAATFVRSKNVPTHLEQLHMEATARIPICDAKGHTHFEEPPLPKTSADYKRYMRQRTNAWHTSGLASASGQNVVGGPTTKARFTIKGASKAEHGKRPRKPARPRANR